MTFLQTPQSVVPALMMDHVPEKVDDTAVLVDMFRRIAQKGDIPWESIPNDSSFIRFFKEKRADLLWSMSRNIFDR